MRKKSKLPIVLVALLFGLAAAAEVATSRKIVQMGGPEMAPHTPPRSERPGEAVALL